VNKRRTLEKRLRALEVQRRLEPTIITLPDGSERKIWRGSNFCRNLLSAGIVRGEFSPAQVADLDLIRRAVTIDGPDAGLLRLAQAIADSPYE
jgi:hypothetical protein